MAANQRGLNIVCNLGVRDITKNQVEFFVPLQALFLRHSVLVILCRRQFTNPHLQLLMTLFLRCD